MTPARAVTSDAELDRYLASALARTGLPGMAVCFADEPLHPR
jgi:hypothetical protein